MTETSTPQEAKNSENPVPGPDISIVIPVYNKGPYLDETLSAVIAVSEPDIEIIIVDDGSTDDSPEIIKKFKDTDSRIRSVRQENRGASAARNAGLDMARGRYVNFHDADDILIPEALAALFRAAEEDRADIVSGTSGKKDASGLRELTNWKTTERGISFRDNPDTILKYCTNISPCNKLYRRSFLQSENIRYTEHLFMEDIEFWLKAMLVSRVYSQLPDMVSIYVLRTDSTSLIKSQERFESCFTLVELLDEFLENKGLAEFSGYRDYALLQSALVFFARWKLDLNAEEEEETDLNRLRGLLEKMSEKHMAIHYVRNKSATAPALLLVRAGRFDEARYILSLGPQKLGTILRGAETAADIVTRCLKAADKAPEALPPRRRKRRVAVPKALGHTFEPKKSLEYIQMWSPPVATPAPCKRPASSLRIALIVGTPLYRAMRFEGETILLTPANSRETLELLHPDLLLVESARQTATGHWHGAMSAPGPGRDELEDIIKSARKASIPTVFWFTAGHEYHDHFFDFSLNFDHIFCADLRELDKYNTVGRKAEYLPCGFPPALFNPYRPYKRRDVPGIPVVFDGWGDSMALGDQMGVLHKIDREDLGIIESRKKIAVLNRTRSEFSDRILGCVAHRDLPSILKYAGAMITLDPTLNNRAIMEEAALRAAACRLPVVHRGEIAPGDIRKGLVLEQPDDENFLLELERLKQDELYRDRSAHKAWRNAFLKHTLSHRVSAVCAAAGVEHDWREFPKAALITPSNRKEHILSCLERYEEQSYPNKECIIVFNGKPEDVPDVPDAFAGREDIRILHIPTDYHTGGAMNLGIEACTGDFCFKLDDDDIYGPNYVLDLMLGLRAVDAGLFGKESSHFHFEGDPAVYRFQNKKRPPCMFSARDMMGPDHFMVGGCSICGERDFLLRTPFPEKNLGNADDIFFVSAKNNSAGMTCFLADRLNMVVFRNRDTKKHTWRQDNELLKKRMHRLTDNLDDLFI